MPTQLKDRQSIEEIIHEMTLEEKACMIMGSSPFRSCAMPKYGIPAIYMIDTCTGLNMREYLGEAMYQKLSTEAEAAGQPLDREKNGYMGGLLLALGALQKEMEAQAAAGIKPGKKETGVYPPALALGCTWNPEIVEECESTVAKELGSKRIDMILGPCINIHRDPLHGRLSETFTEDPMLMGAMGSAAVRGIQKEGLLADIKHFAGNNQEKDRLGIEEHISERALREIYFPGFKACIDAGCKTIMSAYNKVNGVPCAMNKWLLTEVLRKEWGFDGFVVSDWGASYDVPLAVGAGTDLTMPGPLGIKQMIEAVESGKIKEKALDTAIRNILNVTLAAPCFTGKYPTFNLEDTLRVTEETAAESIVLLKNNGVLPMRKESRVTFFGKRSKNFTMIPASVAASTDLGTNPYDRAVEIGGTENVNLDIAPAGNKYWVVTVGADACEGADRPHMDIDEDEKALLARVIPEAKTADGKIVLIINATGPVDLSDYIDSVDAVVCPFFAGMMGGKVTADILYGLVNPSGRLPLTWPKHYYDTPAYKNYGGENKEVWYGEGIYVGYRWYDARHIEPLFPFGHGLSYTNFEFSGLYAESGVNVETADVKVRLNVKNTGSMAGSEVIQLYVHSCDSQFDRPYKELKAFRKIFLEPGEERTVELKLSKADFSSYYAEFGEFIAQPGAYEIQVGTSAGNIVLCKTINVRCRNPFGLSGRTAIGTLVQDDQAVALINSVIEDNIKALAYVAINYAPDKSLRELWNGVYISGALKAKWSDEEIAERYRRIIAGFDEIETGRI